METLDSSCIVTVRKSLPKELWLKLFQGEEVSVLTDTRVTTWGFFELFTTF